jgi:hypothetical protein
MNSHLQMRAPKRATVTAAVVAALVVVVASVALISTVFAVPTASTPKITSGPPPSTNVTSASFSFTNETAKSTFECALDGAVFSVCTSPKSYAGPLADGDHTFRVRAQKKDFAVSSVATYTWRIDRTAPPQPSLTSTPSWTTTHDDATFTWSNTEPGVHYVCALDGAPLSSCASSGITYTHLTEGEHCFAVVALDAAENASAPTTFCWTINGLDFFVSGSALQPLFPGAAPQPLNLVISNPNGYPIRVTGITVAVQPETLNGSCSTSANFDSPHGLLQSAIIPGHSTRSLSDVGVAAADRPQIRMVETHVNQDACKGVTIHLSYSGSAVRA